MDEKRNEWVMKYAGASISATKETNMKFIKFGILRSSISIKFQKNTWQINAYQWYKHCPRY
jgi:hypothetical protein